MQEKFLELEKLVKKAQKILCIAHKKPDGDTVGATNAIYLTMKQFGKQAVMACVDDVPERYLFLEDSKNFVKEFDFREFDLVFVSDAGASYMTKYQQIYPEMFKGEIPMINLDHHATNDNFGTLNIVDIDSASTTVLIFKIWQYLNWPINPSIATSLLTGIYYDTGCLMHQNTTMEVYEIAGKLAQKGAKVNSVVKNVFKTTPVSALKLWGRTLEKAQVNANGVTISVLTDQDFADCNASGEDLSGVVDFLNSVPGSKFTVLLNEDGQGNVKGSFRTRRDDVDVAELAEKFGGGGHKKAAGFTMPGRLHQEIRWKVVSPDGSAEITEDTVPKLNAPWQMISNDLQIPGKA